MLQQKVWINAKQSPLFPNLYSFLVGPPGIGKSQTIGAIGKYLREVDGLHIASTSTTGASLIDELDRKGSVNYSVGLRDEDHINFNSMLVMPDELSALMHEYDRALVAALTTFYDVQPYSQTRRVAKVEIDIPHPQLSILAGTTTSYMMKIIPEGAWDQGLMARTILIFSEDRPLKDDIFSASATPHSEDLAHDLLSIFGLQGPCRVTDPYRAAYNAWRQASCAPAPTHPRLKHYCARRGAHLLKLSIIAAVDTGDDLSIGKEHFDRALEWLTGAERLMPYTFQVSSSVDSRALEEAIHFIGGRTVSQTQLVHFLSERVPLTTVQRSIDLMVGSRMVLIAGQDRDGLNYFKLP